MTGIVTKFRVCAKQVLCFLTSKIGDAAHLDVRSRLINLYSLNEYGGGSLLHVVCE